MNEELKKKFGELALTSSKDLIAWLQSTKAFVANQVPDVLREWLTLVFIDHAVAFGSALAILLVSLVGGFYLVRWIIKMMKQDNDPLPILLCIPPLIGGVFGIVNVIVHGTAMLQIYYAPKAFLLKTMIEMLK